MGNKLLEKRKTNKFEWEKISRIRDLATHWPRIQPFRTVINGNNIPNNAYSFRCFCSMDIDEVISDTCNLFRCSNFRLLLTLH